MRSRSTGRRIPGSWGRHLHSSSAVSVSSSSSSSSAVSSSSSSSSSTDTDRSLDDPVILLACHGCDVPASALRWVQVSVATAAGVDGPGVTQLAVVGSSAVAPAVIGGSSAQGKRQDEHHQRRHHDVELCSKDLHAKVRLQAPAQQVALSSQPERQQSSWCVVTADGS
jgi:hypothetical protein